MTRELARKILNRWCEGTDYPEHVIYRALCATGDIGEGW
jgi:hypothetical protein